MSRGNHYLPTLDGWRCVAISLVLFSHASVALGFGRFKDVGLLGVQVFFGLSGFLITSLLLREEAKNGSISLPAFYRRRAYRILPAALTFLCVVGLLSIAGFIDVTAGRWLSTVFFLANYSKASISWYTEHFWSLAVEEHFYLLWPATLLFVRDNRKRIAIAFGSAMLVALWRATAFKYHLTWTDSAIFWGRTDINADGLMFGCVAALVKDQLKLSRPWVTPLAIGIFAATFIIPSFVGWKLSLAMLTIRAAIVPVMILSTLQNPQALLGRILELKSLRFVGLVSYSLYLWQQLFVTWKPQYVIQHFPLNLIAAFSCAILSYYLIEQPMLRSQRRHVGVGRSSRINPMRGRATTASISFRGASPPCRYRDFPGW